MRPATWRRRRRAPRPTPRPGPADRRAGGSACRRGSCRERRRACTRGDAAAGRCALLARPVRSDGPLMRVSNAAAITPSKCAEARDPLANSGSIGAGERPRAIGSSPCAVDGDAPGSRSRQAVGVGRGAADDEVGAGRQVLGGAPPPGPAWRRTGRPGPPRRARRSYGCCRTSTRYTISARMLERAPEPATTRDQGPGVSSAVLLGQRAPLWRWRAPPAPGRRGLRGRGRDASKALPPAQRLAEWFRPRWRRTAHAC